MIWWTGRGLFIPFAALAPFLLGAEYGRFATAAACLFGAGLVFVLRDWFGEQSSVFSIRVKYWPYIMGVLAVLALFQGPRGRAPAASAAQQLQAGLPRMLSSNLRVDRAELEQGVVHYYGAFKTAVDLDNAAQDDVKRLLAAHYCGAVKVGKAGPPELRLTALNPPRSFNDRVQSVTLSVGVPKCA